MSLNKTQLKTDLRSLYDGTLSSSGSAADAKEAFIAGLADVIDAYIKTEKINYTSGLTAGANPVVGTFNHTVS